MDSWVTPLAVAALLIWILIRRARRLFGRQKYSVMRLGLRLGLIGVLATLLFVVLSVARGVAPIAGLAVGAAVGLLGFALTRFEMIDNELHYTPNLYVGVGVYSLIVGRLLYKVVRVSTMTNLASSGPDSQLAGFRASPLTVGVLFVLLAFYLFYYAAVLVRGSRQREGKRQLAGNHS